MNDITKIKKYITKIKKKLPTYLDIKLLLDTILLCDHNNIIHGCKFYSDIEAARNYWAIPYVVYSFADFYDLSSILNKNTIPLFSTFLDYSQFRFNEYRSIVFDTKVDDSITDIGMQFIESDVICLHTLKEFDDNKTIIQQLSNIKFKEMFIDNDNNELDLSLCIEIIDQYFKEIYYSNNESIKKEIDVNKNIDYYRLINYKNVPKELLNYYGEPYYSIKFRVRIPLKIKDININMTESKKICVNANILFFPFLHKCAILSFVPNIIKKYKNFGKFGKITYKCEDIITKLITSKYSYQSDLKTIFKMMLTSYCEFLFTNIQQNVQYIFNDEIYVEHDDDKLFLSYIDPMIITIGNLYDNNNLIRISANSNHTLYFPFEYGKRTAPILIDSIGDIKQIKTDYIDSKEKNGNTELYYLLDDIKKYKYEFYERTINIIKCDRKNDKFFPKHEEIRKWIIDIVNEKFNKGKKYKVDYQAFKIFVIKYDLNGITFSLNLPLSSRSFNSDYKVNDNYCCTPYRFLFENEIDQLNIFAIIKIYFNDSKPRIRINPKYLESDYKKGNELDSLLTFFVESNQNLQIIDHEYNELINKNERSIICKEYLKFLYTDIVNSEQFLNYLNELMIILKNIVDNDKKSNEILELINKAREKYNSINIGIGKDLLNDETNGININDYDNIVDYFIETMFYIDNDDYIIKKIKVNDN